MSALKKWGVKTQLLFFALFGGWKINYVVTKAVFKQPLNVSVLLNPLEIKRLWVVSMRL